MSIFISDHDTAGFSWQRWHINRPERLNALGTTLANELADAAELIGKRQTVNQAHRPRAIVITAETVVRGERAIWIAGGDLKELALLTEKHQGRQYAQTMRRLCEGFEYLPVPVITVVDGAAIGGGAELALAGDIRFATARSTFEFKQLQMGLATGYGTASRLIELVGKSAAQSLLFFCETVDAETAHRSSLIHRLISATSVEEIGRAILPILKIEPLAVSAQKKMLRLATSNPGADRRWADDVFESIWQNPTHNFNLRSFGKTGDVGIGASKIVLKGPHT